MIYGIIFSPIRIPKTPPVNVARIAYQRYFPTIEAFPYPRAFKIPICVLSSSTIRVIVVRLINAATRKIRQGNFVTPDGKILGKHKGIIHYTVGQRKGLGLALGYPAFVLEIRPETDEVVIGTYEESLTHTLRANELNFMSVEDITEPIRVFAKIRYNHKGAWCTVEKTGEDEITCTFDEPIRAVTPGQAVVLYDGEYVLGGGTIL